MPLFLVEIVLVLVGVDQRTVYENKSTLSIKLAIFVNNNSQ